MALFFHWTFCTHQLYSQLFTQMFLSHHDFIGLFENIFHCFHFVWNISWRHHRGPWGVEKSICPHKVATPEHQLSHKPRVNLLTPSVGRRQERPSSGSLLLLSTRFSKLNILHPLLSGSRHNMPPCCLWTEFWPWTARPPQWDGGHG